MYILQLASDLPPDNEVEAAKSSIIEYDQVQNTSIARECDFCGSLTYKDNLIKLKDGIICSSCEEETKQYYKE